MKVSWENHILKKIKFLFLLVLGVATQALQAQEMSYELDPAKTKIEFSVPATMHTVHGTFQLKSGSIQFDAATGKADGLVVVDVKSGQTGNDGRDRKMHREVLQSERYPQATFRPTRLNQGADLKQNPTVQVSGILNIHGSDHEVTLAVPVQQTGDELTTTIRFVIPYTEWGLKNPSTFILHVSNQAQMEITTSGRLVHGKKNDASPH
jgi:polyisoprenoid-binding protein YceI